MPSAIIESYLKDPSIDAAKKQNMATKLDSGEWKEADLEAKISSKYGNKYGSAFPKVAPQPQKQKEYDWGGEFMKNLNPATYYEKAFAPAVSLTANMATDSVKPLVKGAAMASAGGIMSSNQALGAQMAGKSAQEIEAERRRPIDLPWVGNINPATSPLATVGTAVNFGSTAANFAVPFKGVGQAALRGAVQGAAQDWENNPNSNVISTLGNAATGALVGGIAQKLFGGTKIKAERQAEKLGIAPDIIQRTKSLSPEENALQNKFFNLSKAKSIDPDNAVSATESVAADLTSGLQKLYNFRQQAGKKIGSIKSNAINTVSNNQIKLPIADARKSFLSDLADKGVTVSKNGTLNFKGSVYEGSAGDQSILKAIWNMVKKKDGITEKEALLFRERLQGDLYRGTGINRTISSAEGIAQNFERNLTKKVHQNNTQLKNLDELFSDLSTIVEGGKKATSGTNPLIEKEAISGSNAWNLIRKSMGAGNKHHIKILQKIEEAGQKYGIPELKNIVRNRRLAQTADDIFSIDASTMPTSLSGRIVDAGKSMMQGRPVDSGVSLLKAGADYLKKSPTRQKVLTQLAQKSLRNKQLGIDEAKTIFQKKVLPLAVPFARKLILGSQ